MVTFQYNGHRFDINWSGWTGKETIFYDGRVVSDLRNLTSFTSRHEFDVIEEGQTTRYLFIMAEFGQDIEGRRNGLLFYSRSKGGVLVPESYRAEREERGEPRIIKETIIKEITLVVCPHCGHRNDSSNRKCERCSASI